MSTFDDFDDKDLSEQEQFRSPVAVEGNRNLVAINESSIIIADKRSDSAIKEFCRGVENSINRLFPKGFRSPSRNRRRERFDCNIFLSSLLKAGITVEAAEVIMRRLPKELQRVVSSNEEPSTEHIRRAVILAIERLVGTFPLNEIKKWRERYARQYGNPDTRIVVYEDNGKENVLTHKYLREALLPDVIRHTLNIKEHEVEHTDKPLIARSQLDGLAQHLMDIIMDLGIYRLRYKTVFALAEDLFASPPRMWLIHPEKVNEVVSYRLEKARISHERLSPFLKDLSTKTSSSIPVAIHAELSSLSDLMYQSAMAIFALYGKVSAADNAVKAIEALYQTLKRSIYVYEPNSDTVEFELSSIAQLPLDLRIAGQSLDNLSSRLKKMGPRWSRITDMILRDPQDEKLKEELFKALRDAEKLYKIAVKLREVREKRGALRSIDVLRLTCYESIQVVEQILKGFGFSYSWVGSKSSASHIIARPPRGEPRLYAFDEYSRVNILINCGHTRPILRGLTGNDFASVGTGTGALLLVDLNEGYPQEALDELRTRLHSDGFFYVRLNDLINAFNSSTPYYNVDMLLSKAQLE